MDDHGTVLSDEACERINWLTQHCLQYVAQSEKSGGWETLFRDPQDGRLWERTFPSGEMHGGGPPKLAVISLSEASMKYRLD